MRVPNLNWLSMGSYLCVLLKYSLVLGIPFYWMLFNVILIGHSVCAQFDINLIWKYVMMLNSSLNWNNRMSRQHKCSYSKYRWCVFAYGFFFYCYYFVCLVSIDFICAISINGFCKYFVVVVVSSIILQIDMCVCVRAK